MEMYLFSERETMQEQPFYSSSYMGFWIRIYSNRIEFKAGLGTQSVPLAQVASVQVARMLVHQITIETTGGQKYGIPTNRKKEVQQAIYQAQSQFLNPGPYNPGYPPPAPSPSVADEITKLHDLMQRGIISQEDFERRKRQMLG
jgi:hypothetical protein